MSSGRGSKERLSLCSEQQHIITLLTYCKVWVSSQYFRGPCHTGRHSWISLLWINWKTYHCPIIPFNVWHIDRHSSAHTKANDYCALQMDRCGEQCQFTGLCEACVGRWLSGAVESSRELPTNIAAEDIFSTVDLHLGSVDLIWDKCGKISSCMTG